MRAVEESTIDRRGLVALYVLYQLTWTIAMFYAWPEGYRLPPIAPPAPMMIQIASSEDRVVLAVRLKKRPVVNEPIALRHIFRRRHRTSGRLDASPRAALS